MRILHVASSLDPRGGGVAEAIRQLGAALVRAGHETAVATADDPTAPWLADLPFPVHALGPSRGSYQYARELPAWVARQNGHFDCLISHGLWQHHGWAAGRNWRGPRFVFAHGMLDPWFARAYPGKHLKKWLYWPWAEYRILRSATAVFFTCEEERLLARRSFWWYRVNEAVSPLGIEEPPVESERQEEAFRNAYPQLSGRRLVLFLGRLAVKKGCDQLVRAFGELAALRPAEASLVMAGPAEDAAFLQQLRASAGEGPAVVWTGMLTGDTKWGALRAAEAFILPSHQENFGLAVVESLARGRPVLISNKVNIWREIDADGAGIVEEDSAAGAERLLARWWGLAEGERQAMGARARACFEERFQIDRAAGALVERLRERGVAG